MHFSLVPGFGWTVIARTQHEVGVRLRRSKPDVTSTRVRLDEAGGNEVASRLLRLKTDNGTSFARSPA